MYTAVYYVIESGYLYFIVDLCIGFFMFRPDDEIVLRF